MLLPAIKWSVKMAHFYKSVNHLAWLVNHKKIQNTIIISANNKATMDTMPN
jgi:hypothetical protein